MNRELFKNIVLQCYVTSQTVKNCLSGFNASFQLHKVITPSKKHFKASIDNIVNEAIRKNSIFFKKRF